VNEHARKTTCRVFFSRGHKSSNYPPTVKSTRAESSWGTGSDLSAETHVAPPPELDHIYIHLPIYEIFRAVLGSGPSPVKISSFPQKICLSNPRRPQPLSDTG
jgi:hypothetical protein